MKKFSINVVLLVIICTGSLFAQNPVTNKGSYRDIAEVEINNTLFFMEKYDININRARKARILESTVIWSNPSIDSKKMNFVIKKGTVVEMFKYFPKEVLWAINYKNFWGFVSASKVIPIRGKSSAPIFTPYDEAPKMLSTIKIAYPKEAKKNGIDGIVTISVLISKTGLVEEAEIVDGIPELDASAIKAIKKVKFKPGKHKGKPVNVWMDVPVHFEID
ncbi:MAG: energy transducer TonB [Bacteroidales bacterium]|nr:energy transducer TonB [Bacteroidales bacterium]